LVAPIAFAKRLPRRIPVLLTIPLPALHLERSIRFVKERLSARRAVIRGLHFHLNAADLEQIQQARERGQSLYLSARFLSDLRAYILFPAWGALPPTLAFVTYYYDAAASSGEAALRSSIALDGDVLHQICDRHLADPDLALRLTSAHYWLIDQLLSRLKLESRAALNRLTQGLRIAIFLACAASQLPQWLQLNGLSLASSALLTFGLPYLARPLLARLWPRLQRWLLRQIFNGLLANRDRLRRAAFKLLSYFT